MTFRCDEMPSDFKKEPTRLRLVEVAGQGNGDILGGITIARFNRTSGGFLAPTFTTSGGGNSNVQYDSQSVSRGIGSGTNVSGVREF